VFLNFYLDKKLYKSEYILEYMEKLHPGARWSFRLGVYSSFIFIFIILLFFGFQWMTGDRSGGDGFLSTVLLILIIAIGIVVILGEIYARMAYNRWLYEFTPHELKLEKGIIFKNYRSVPYERIQNVEIHRGILARMLGFSSLEIHTAGYSGGYQGRRRVHAEGYIPAVFINKAEHTREFLMKKISKRHGSGV